MDPRNNMTCKGPTGRLMEPRNQTIRKGPTGYTTFDDFMKTYLPTALTSDQSRPFEGRFNAVKEALDAVKKAGPSKCDIYKPFVSG